MGARVTLSGTLVDIVGQPIPHASLRLAPSYRHAAVDLAAERLVDSRPIDILTDAQGHFQRAGLYACDDPDVTPTGWNYLVIEPTGRRYYIALSVDQPEQDWSEVVPVDSPNPGYALVLDGTEAVEEHNTDPAAHPDIRALIGAGEADIALKQQRTASSILSGHRLVVPTTTGSLEYADRTMPAHRQRPIWLTLAAAVSGAPVLVLLAGAHTEPSWSWSPGPLYLGVDGQITQTLPMSGFLAQVGYATSPTSVYLDRQPSLALV